MGTLKGGLAAYMAAKKKGAGKVVKGATPGRAPPPAPGMPAATSPLPPPIHPNTHHVMKSKSSIKSGY